MKLSSTEAALIDEISVSSDSCGNATFDVELSVGGYFEQTSRRIFYPRLFAVWKKLPITTLEVDPRESRYANGAARENSSMEIFAKPCLSRGRARVNVNRNKLGRMTLVTFSKK